jgi:hypothetical protein
LITWRQKQGISEGLLIQCDKQSAAAKARMGIDIQQSDPELVFPALQEGIDFTGQTARKR